MLETISLRGTPLHVCTVAEQIEERVAEQIEERVDRKALLRKSVRELA